MTIPTGSAQLNELPVASLFDAQSRIYATRPTGTPVGEQVPPSVLLAYLNSFYQPSGTVSDWNNFPGTLTWKGSDSPTFNVDATGDVTGTIAVGAKIKLTHWSEKCFIVTSIGTPSGTVTPMTFYGGTDFALSASGTIISPQYSHMKSPLGFPMDKTKWRVTLTDTSTRSQVTSGATVYNLGSLSINVPIGQWLPKWNIATQWNHASAADHYMYVSLSTANNAHNTAMAFSMAGNSTMQRLHVTHNFTPLIVASKTTYYLVASDSGATGATVYFLNAVSDMFLYLECAYL